MGEASRRKKLDPSYGKIVSLNTPSLKNEHLDKVFQELIRQAEFVYLLRAETVPENYHAVAEQIRLWLEDKLSVYKEEDRADMARFIFRVLTDIREGNSPNYIPVSSFKYLPISCVFKAVKDYFTPDQLQGLIDRINKNLKAEGKSSITDPRTKFAFEQIIKEAELSLAVD
jgi:hypothetical protein